MYSVEHTTSAALPTHHLARAHLKVLAVSLLIASPVMAQTTITARPINPDAPDVVEFRSQSRDEPSDLLRNARELGLPADQFFATIDPSRAVVRAEAQSDDLIEQAAAQICPEELVASDPDERRGWFQVNYGSPCNMSLYCNWLVDTATDTADFLRSDEQGVSSDIISAGVVDPDPRLLAELPEIAQYNDDHTDGYPELSMTLVLAGTRPCTLTRYCDGRDDLLCDARFLSLKAGQIAIQQMEE